MRDITLEDTVDLKFTTTVNGTPTILSGSPTVAAYVGNGTTEITAGLTLSVDFDTRTGLNNVRVVATAANGFTSPTDVSLVMTAGTVGGVTVVGKVVGEFSIGRSAAVVAVATAQADLDLLTGTDGATLATAQGNYAPNVVVPPSVAQFDARTLVAGSYFDPAVDAVANVTLVATTTTNTDMVAAAPTAAANADAVWDEVLTGATHNVTNSAGRRLRTLQTGGNYEGGMVWVDTVAGVAGTVTDENGVVTNPVSTLADARTLATAIPLKALHIANGSTITLASTTANFLVQGHEWILALGGQDISGTNFEGANAVTGTSSGTTDVQFEDCVIGNGSTGATLPPGTYIRCGFNTGSGFAFTGSAAGRYVFVDCYSNIAVGGASTPFFVFTGASAVMFRRYSGGANITFDAATAALTYECLGGGNLTVALAGSDLQARGTIRDMTITGMTSASLVEFVGTIGNLSIAGADGTVTLDGIVGAVVDSRTGSPTLNLPANTMGVVGNITGNLSGSVGSVTGAVGSVTGAVGSVTGSVGSVTGSVGSVVGHTAQTGDTYALANGASGFTATNTVVDAIKVITDALGATAAANLALSAGAAGIVVGAAEAGTLSTTVMTSDLAEATDDHYIGRAVIWTSGVLLGQASDVTDYTALAGTLTYTATTEAPGAGDTFILV